MMKSMLTVSELLDGDGANDGVGLGRRYGGGGGVLGPSTHGCSGFDDEPRPLPGAGTVPSGMQASSQ